MRTAIRLANGIGAKVALIDQNIQLTLQKLKKNLTWKEKIRFISDIFKAPFQKKIRIDLNKVPKQEVINKLIKDTKSRYPSVYKILVEERNYIMAKNLNKIIKNNPTKKIIAIVGAGHEEAILNLVKQWN
ncbi:TraB/GumN family protein [Candidatus Pacearchaeota archaeon]|nr:TraB/GumN family protein [Candidatus Pacearchaeota archaeon]